MLVYVILLPASHLYTTCGAAPALPAWAAARTGAIATAMHSAATMAIDLMLCPYGQRTHQGPAITVPSRGLIPSGSDCFLCTQDALHGRATIGHGFHSQVVFDAEGFHLCERTFRLFVLRLGVGW